MSRTTKIMSAGGRNHGCSSINFGSINRALISRVQTSILTDEFSLHWIGPYLVDKVHGADIYRVQSLIGKKDTINTQRLMMYEGK
eukprot:snap_masked-scaffold_23-processed-gene-0.17-mRNA-1 protein AED:1.00 eAED:1.00 QI:0/0/0/0/1/1/2/0/84